MVSFRTINWFSLKTISRTFQVLCVKFKLKLCLNVLKPATAINALVVLFLNHNTYFRSVLSPEGKTGQVKNIELNQQQKFLLLRKLTTEIIHESSFSFSSEKRKKNCQMVNTTFRTRLWLKLSNPGVGHKIFLGQAARDCRKSKPLPNLYYTLSRLYFLHLKYITLTRKR